MRTVGWKEYFKDMFNYINLISIFTKLMITVVFGFNLAKEGDFMFVCLSIAIFFAWANALFWIRFFDSMSHYFHMIVVTL